MGKKCFIITPIGDKNSEIFRHIQGVIHAVIKPLLMKYGFDDIKAAHEIDEPGSINNQLINRILEDDLVIANLTTNNANVMYELAIRHSVAKPVIHICQYGTKLPFDLNNERTIFYTNDFMGTIELEEGLKRFLDNIDYEKKYYDNPIYNAKQRSLLLDNLSQDDPVKIIIQMMEEMKGDLSREIKNSFSNSAEVKMTPGIVKRLNIDSKFSDKYITPGIVLGVNTDIKASNQYVPLEPLKIRNDSLKTSELIENNMNTASISIDELKGNTIINK